MRSYFVIAALAVASLFISTPSFAQAAANKELGWDQGASNLAEANGYTYGYFPDAVTTKLILTPVVCTGAASPFLCKTPFPAFTPGSHTLQMVAGNVAGDSPKSVVLSFSFFVVPTAPGNPRVVINLDTMQIYVFAA